MNPALDSLIRHGRMLAVGICTLGAVTSSFAQGACEVATVTASDGGVFDSFGWSVAVSGETAVVGTNPLIGGDPGSAHMFQFDGSTWVETQELLASDGESGNLFGWAVAIDGDIAVIGARAHLHDDSGCWVTRSAGPSPSAGTGP